MDNYDIEDEKIEAEKEKVKEMEQKEREMECEERGHDTVCDGTQCYCENCGKEVDSEPDADSLYDAWKEEQADNESEETCGAMDRF